MKNIREIFDRIQEKKREQREISRAVRDGLDGSGEYRQIVEQIDMLRAKKARIEDSIRGEMEKKLDLLKLDIKDGLQSMSDIALTSLMKGESVKLVDNNNIEYEPVFSVRFKRKI